MNTDPKKATMSADLYTSRMNHYKHVLANVSEGVPRREWIPLRSWPAAQHPRQAEIDQIRAIKSLVS